MKPDNLGEFDLVLRETIATIEAIQSRQSDIDPETPNHIRTIHRSMKQYPELCHLLTPQQIQIFVAGLKSVTQTELIAAAAKKPAAKRGAKISVSLDDI